MSKYTTRELLDKVVSWRDQDVVSGYIELSDEYLISRFDDIYGKVEVAGEWYSSGAIIQALDSVRFESERREMVRCCLEDEMWYELERENFGEFEFEEGFEPEEDDVEDDE